MVPFLSADLFPGVLQHLSKKDILACLQVSSFFNTLVTPALWSDITFGGPPHMISVYGGCNSFLDEKNSDNWKYVKCLKIWTNIYWDHELEKLSAFIERSENISSLQVIGGISSGKDRSAMDKNWLPFLYSSKLLSRIVHLIFYRVVEFPLRSIVTRCPRLRSLDLMRSAWTQEVSKDEVWSELQLDGLAYGPFPEDRPDVIAPELEPLLQSLHTLHFDPSFWVQAQPQFMYHPTMFLDAVPLVYSSLRHLSLGGEVWKHIFLCQSISYEPQLLPLADLQSLQSLTITNKGYQPTGTLELNCFCRWLCRHFSIEGNLSPSFAAVTIIWDIIVEYISEDREVEHLSTDLTRELIYSQLHLNFILCIWGLFREGSDSDFRRCSQILKSWGEDLLEAGKMTLVWR
ncbi:hypothetical protein DL96DRAFT_1818116 [Flagelloscypha sp. PMI_526]|nr:hypothetical protein DL96DRAFT_1818116 [Flagelloscypha sp. PMI_526]